jgi:hypothetical protein
MSALLFQIWGVAPEFLSELLFPYFSPFPLFFLSLLFPRRPAVSRVWRGALLLLPTSPQVTTTDAYSSSSLRPLSPPTVPSCEHGRVAPHTLDSEPQLRDVRQLRLRDRSAHKAAGKQREQEEELSTCTGTRGAVVPLSPPALVAWAFGCADRCTRPPRLAAGGVG